MEEREQVAVEIDGGELARPEVGRRDAALDGRMEDVGRLQLGEQRVDVVDLDATARRAAPRAR